jgi:hypothetical protein
MRSIRLLVPSLALALTTISSRTSAMETPIGPQEADFQQYEAKRTDAYAAQLETWLRTYLVDQYAERAARAWNRDYSGIAEYEKSVEPNRAGWRNVIRPPRIAPAGEMQRRPHPPLDDLQAQWLTAPLGALTAEGIFSVPASASSQSRVPLVIVQHGIGSFPERNFGVADEGDSYHSYARRLVESGFAVLTPMNLRSVERRNRIERLCRLADLSLPGIELVRMQRLLDEVLKDPRIDGDRVGMWGLSLGGLATMFWTPLEPRIKAAVVAGWFNHRRNKMVIPDARYSCFLETREEHAFFDGWLTAYSDSDVASLICPRPLLIQTGKKDGIAWWPMVLEEFDAAKTHYRRLGMEDRIEMDLRDGGHETHVESGLRFLTRWLKESPPGSGRN